MLAAVEGELAAVMPRGLTIMMLKCRASCRFNFTGANENIAEIFGNKVLLPRRRSKPEMIGLLITIFFDPLSTNGATANVPTTTTCFRRQYCC